MNDQCIDGNGSEARVFTITANTAVDWVLNIENFQFGHDYSIEQSHRYAAGKGINAARALASASVSVTALGFVGYESKDLFDKIGVHGMSVDLIPVSGDCRNNVTLTDTVNSRQSHLRSKGYQVSREDCKNLLQMVDASIRSGDKVIVTGSLPTGAEPDFYQQLIELCQSQQCRVYFDSSGEPLKSGIKAKPYLIKPNLMEFEQLHSRSFSDLEAIIDAAKKLIADGIMQVCVSRAELGLVYVDSTGVYVANCDTNDLGAKQSYVGCGDALLAGLVIGDLRSMQIIEKIKFAVACSVANMYTFQPGLLNALLLKKIIHNVSVSPY